MKSLLLLLLWSALVGVRAAPHPNIILVMADDVGYGDFSCLGNPIIKTPAIDRFARESVRFTNFHVSPTCAPTRAALMTGRHEFKNGVTHTIFERERLTLKARTIADLLKAAGYHTGIFGKWHLGDEPAYQPGQRGFEEVFVHGGGGIGQTYPGSCGDAPGNTYFDPAILHNGKFEKTRGYCTDVFFNQALHWIDEKRKERKPFFAYIPLNAAHEPLQVPEEYYARHHGEVSDNAARFFGMIENIDDNFAVLLRRLREWGLENNTLVVFMTDNGGTVGTKIFNAGMRAGKGTPYEGATRVPSFWRWPAGFQGGQDCSALAAHIDIFRTFAHLAGARLDRGMREQVEGRDLFALLKNPGSRWPDRFLATHVGRWSRGEAAQAKYKNCAIRNTRYALVNNRELYDLQSDPGQSHNVIEEYPREASLLRAAYEKWWANILPGLVNEDAIGPRLNPFKELYWRQFGGRPDEALLKQMDPMNILRNDAAQPRPASRR